MTSIKVVPLREDLAFGARINGVNHQATRLLREQRQGQSEFALVQSAEFRSTQASIEDP